ncbi:hypothetical protein MKK70_22105 [Methylobacterium sp. E-041]|uniref:hypothetical protein n=1 Tax=Methylobacterium sp. E-041 TaxID=2836573 RepID=UPI001FBBD239|nr:hypothetical protein [Methylobacterium sp. E-041]MCJ2108017.1 hypothetical protein [Methylobacterium sp. E-041]
MIRTLRLSAFGVIPAVMALVAGASGARADMVFPQAQMDGNGYVKLRGGPTLGRNLLGQFYAVPGRPFYSAGLLGGVVADDGTDQTSNILDAIQKVPAAGGTLLLPCGKILYSSVTIPNPRLRVGSFNQRCVELTSVASAASLNGLTFTGDYSGSDGLTFAHLDFEGGVARTGGYTVNLANGYGYVRDSLFRHCFICVRMGATGGTMMVEGNTFAYAADGVTSPGSGYILVDNSSVGPHNIIARNLGLSNFLDNNPANRRYPDAAVTVTQTGELYAFANDWVSNRTSYKIVPGNGQRVEKVTLAIGSNDSAQAGNVVVRPVGTGRVFDLSIPTPWLTNSKQIDSAVNTIGVDLDASAATPTASFPYPINMVSITGGGQITSTTGQTGSGLRCKGPVYNVTVTGVSFSGWEKGIQAQAGCSHLTAADNKIGKFSPFGGAAAPSPNDTNKVGIAIEAGTDAIIAHDNDLTGNTTAALQNASTGINNRFHDNLGYNPIGGGTVTVSASPMQLGPLPTTASYVVFGGSAVTVTVGAANGGGNLSICPGSPCSFTIPAGQLATMTYTAAPTVNQILH